MPWFFGTRFLSRIAKKMSRKKTRSSEAADEALALELEDEEMALELQLQELNFDSPPRSPLWHHHASSSATTSNSRAAHPGSNELHCIVIFWSASSQDLSLDLSLSRKKKYFDLHLSYGYRKVATFSNEYCAPKTYNSAS